MPTCRTSRPRAAPTALWLTDITEHPTREGKVYCAVVLDVYSRRVVGWSIDQSATAALTTNALGMALENRTPAAGATLIHSDHGVQFTSWAFTERAKQSGLVPSMGSVGDCFDNAVMEAFWSAAGRAARHPSLEDALHIEVFHNQPSSPLQPRHAQPIEYETMTTIRPSAA